MRACSPYSDDGYLDVERVVPQNHVCDECERRPERCCRLQQWSLEFLETPEEFFVGKNAMIHSNTPMSSLGSLSRDLRVLGGDAKDGNAMMLL